ncbi:hypothetical protein PI125_g2400 [Phytophthora idaei]|nr:hypothetical protein PI125_g2400 [Phytophthora idaei]KAG3171285.1 hypothetical protein PI126_g1960 [Phytophthora idaei]
MFENPPRNQVATCSDLCVTPLHASLAQQEAPSSAVTMEMSVSRLTSEVVVRKSVEEEDNSADEDYSSDSEVTIGSGDGEECDEESCQSADEDTEDISIHWFDPDLHQQVMDPIQADVCGSRCFESKAKALESLLCSLSQMTQDEKTTSMYTLLGVLMQMPTVERQRGRGEREKVSYFLPFVGRVCRPVFAKCYGESPLTVQRYKTRVRVGNISVKCHGNALNKNASQIDCKWLVTWFQEFEVQVGDVVPVRVRLQKSKDGVVRKCYSSELYTLLPTKFTWDMIRVEMQAYVETIRLRVREPAKPTMPQLLSQLCPTIKIRSPRSNVCDV